MLSRSSILAFLLAFLAGLLVPYSPRAGAVMQMVTPQGTVFVWTAEEMEKLEGILSSLVRERNDLRDQLAKMRKPCT